MSSVQSIRVAVGLLVLLLTLPVSAQNITGALTGVVIDPASAAVPGARVDLINQQTQAKQSTTANEAGIFLFPSLLPGSYTISVSMDGFRSHQVKDIAITMNERRSLGDIVLQVGQVQEKVEVTAEATPIQTASSERAGLVDSDAIAQHRDSRPRLRVADCDAARHL
jgi:hypothetical protein